MLIFFNQLNYTWPELSESELRRFLTFHHNDKKLATVLPLLSIFVTAVNIWLWYYIDKGDFNRFEYFASLIALVVVNSTLGLTLAHDLLHRDSKWAQAVGNLSLFTMALPYFYNDHRYTHHQNLGTPDDVTTARKNESFYHYLWRVPFYRLKTSFTLKNEYPEHLRKKIFNQNWLKLGLVLVLITALTVYAQKAVVLYLAQSLLVYLMFEAGNYIQHYGLDRKPGTDIGVEHSWNCYHRYTNYITFFLPVHSPHHISGDLDRMEKIKGPRLPSVYFKTMLLILMPHLWYRKMNPLLEDYARENA